MSCTLQRFLDEIGPNRKANNVDEREISRYVQTVRRSKWIAENGSRKRVDGGPMGEKRRSEIRTTICSFMVEATKGAFCREEVGKIKSHTVARERKEIVWLEKEEARRLARKMNELFGAYWGDMAEIQLGMGWRPSELAII